MGRDVYEASGVGRTVYDISDDVLGYALSTLCFEGPEDELQQTKHAQPALFATSLAYFEAARDLHSVPDAAFVAGHSLGEYTALVATGAINLEDGLRLVQERGRLMQEEAERRPGAMAAILGLDEEAVGAICGEAGAEVCNLNAPGQVVIGGSAETVEAAMALALERGAQRGVRLKVSGAFHTSFMQPAAEGMAKAVAEASLRDPRVPVVANTNGEPITTADGLRVELVQQLTQPVRWQRSVEYLRSQGVDAVIEFGPGRVLTGLARRIDRSIAVRNVSSFESALAPSTPNPP